MSKNLEPTNTFCIAFDTRERPGMILCVQVTLDHRWIGPEDTVRLDLSNHPLYPDLVRHVLNNLDNDPANPRCNKPCAAPMKNGKCVRCDRR
jgi:hypothetical protein